MNQINSIEKARKVYQEGDFAAAAALYSSIIELNASAQLYYEHALCLLQLYEKKYALQQLNKAVDLEPENPFRYSSRAYVKDALGDTKGAIEDYKKCIRIDPEDAIAHNNLGMLYDKMGRKEIAKQHVKQADKLAGAYEYLEQQKEKEFADKQNPKKEEETPVKTSISSEILKVFRDKNSRRDFFTFVRKGWKI